MKTQKDPKDHIHESFILSIGPQTDMVLEHFELTDALIPRLRTLAQTVRSGRWEAALSSAEWGSFSPEQAASLSDALLLDIQANHFSVSLPKVSSVPTQFCFACLCFGFLVLSFTLGEEAQRICHRHLIPNPYCPLLLSSISSIVL